MNRGREEGEVGRVKKPTGNLVCGKECAKREVPADELIEWATDGCETGGKTKTKHKSGQRGPDRHSRKENRNR